MQTEHLFSRDEVAPSWWANALNRLLSQYAEGLYVIASDATHIQIPAGPDDAAALVSIGGLWRYMESTLTVAMPGGAAGDFDVFLTAKASNIVATPAPYTDNTDYSFAVEIHPVGTTPTIVAGTVDVYRRVARVGWDGAAISYVDQVEPVTPLHAHKHAVGGSDPVTPAAIGAAASTDQRFHEPGDLKMSARSAPSAGWLLCDGSAISRTTFGSLFAAIGITYGAGDGSTTFNLPDYRGRVIMGAGAGAGLTARARGDTGGDETHTHAVPSNGVTVTVPAHSHTLSAAGGAKISPQAAINAFAVVWAGTLAGNYTASGSVQTAVTGSNGGGSSGFQGPALYGATDNSAAVDAIGATSGTGTNQSSTMQPYGVANVFIKT